MRWRGISDSLLLAIVIVSFGLWLRVFLDRRVKNTDLFDMTLAVVLTWFCATGLIIVTHIGD
jgi:hypothetical protein